MESDKRELMAEYIKCQKRQDEIMEKLSIKDAIYLFYALADAGVHA